MLRELNIMLSEHNIDSLLQHGRGVILTLIILLFIPHQVEIEIFLLNLTPLFFTVDLEVRDSVCTLEPGML